MKTPTSSAPRDLYQNPLSIGIHLYVDSDTTSFYRALVDMSIYRLIWNQSWLNAAQ